MHKINVDIKHYSLINYNYIHVKFFDEEEVLIVIAMDCVEIENTEGRH